MSSAVMILLGLDLNVLNCIHNFDKTIAMETFIFFQYAELASRGEFSREDIITVLTTNHGDLEGAYNELSKTQLKPFLMRIWGPPVGTENEAGNEGAVPKETGGEGKRIS